MATREELDALVMARLRPPFGCEFIDGEGHRVGRWRIHDANDDAIASCAPAEEGYARLIVDALNAAFKHGRYERVVIVAWLRELGGEAAALASDIERGLHVSKKRPYHPPTLRELGTIDKLTKGAGGGSIDGIQGTLKPSGQ